MFPSRRTAVLVTTAVLTVPAAVLTAAPAQADVERHGRCGSAVYEFSVDRERGGFEVELEIDRAKPKSQWKVLMYHDGKRFVNQTFRADREGELDVERWRGNTAGYDKFTFRATRSDGAATCTNSITVR
ncbi:hypothetical protein [Intrasporangium sp.]|uniref:hypothetical protein n=1 Tax=Intrasporangium sp. TaxID=1925024 RepID=UPI0032221623